MEDGEEIIFLKFSSKFSILQRTRILLHRTWLFFFFRVGWGRNNLLHGPIQICSNGGIHQISVPIIRFYYFTKINGNKLFKDVILCMDGEGNKRRRNPRTYTGFNRIKNEYWTVCNARRLLIGHLMGLHTCTWAQRCNGLGAIEVEGFVTS